MNIEEIISHHAASAEFDSIDDLARDAAIRGVADTLGCIVAAARAPGIDTLAALPQQWGGRAESSVIGYNYACPAPLAAWVNGAMARALEIDDCTDLLPLHPSAALAPALFALAEARGPIQGKEVVTAMAVGQDLLLRLAGATRIDGITSGRYNLFKVFAVAGASARLLRLDAERLRSAMGLAFSWASGEAESAMDGSLAFRLQDGNAAQAGVTAALLAEGGFTGPKQFLTGRMGFFTSFEPDPLLHRLTEGLGARWRGVEISVKPYSACRCTHTAIGLALSQRERWQGLANDVSKIAIRVSPAVHKLVGAPLSGADQAPTQSAAQFSLAYTVAAALVHGQVFLQQFTAEALSGREVLSLAQRIKVVADPKMYDAGLVTGRIHLQIHTRNGAIISLEGAEPPGNPVNPASSQMLRQKFVDCFAAAPTRHTIDADQLWSTLLNIADAPDVGAIVRSVR